MNWYIVNTLKPFFLAGSFTHDDFKEPIDIALDLDDNVVVADNGLGSVLVFETSGKLLRTIGSRGQGRGQFKDISAVTVAPSGDILVADSRIQVFNPAGEFLREIFPQVSNTTSIDPISMNKARDLFSFYRVKAKAVTEALFATITAFY